MKKNKKYFTDKYMLIGASGLGVIIAFIFLFAYSGGQFNNSFWDRVTQGEVLAGIVIALPTIITWNISINEKRDNEKKTISNNIRETVKYYDRQLYEITSEIIDNNELTLQKAIKIDYIINTFNNLLSEWNDKAEVPISLDYTQVLSAVSSIKYPDGIDSPSNKEAEKWKNNVAIALKPTLKKLIEQKNADITDILSSVDVKYFSQITFGKEGYKLEKIKFNDKNFIECTFSPDFMLKNTFKNCKFIECSITDTVGDADQLARNLKLYENEILGTFKISKDDGDEVDILDLYDKQQPSNLESKYGRVFDTREGIVADSYIEGEKYYQFESNSSTRKDIYNDIISAIKGEKIADGIKYNNVKISISKNYITDDNSTVFLPNSQFSGWHSLFSEKIDQANNFKFYVFCIRNEEKYNTIIFREESFKQFIQLKVVGKTGKYNFYFNGFKSE